MTHTVEKTRSLQSINAFKRRLPLAFDVLEFGEMGFSVQIGKEQVFRATRTEGQNYLCKHDARIFGEELFHV